MATIRVGTAGWTDPSLIQSKAFYPKAATRPRSGCASRRSASRWSKWTRATTRWRAHAIRRLAEHVAQVQVAFNNNAGDQGQRNGRSLMRILGDDAVQPADRPARRRANAR